MGIPFDPDEDSPSDHEADILGKSWDMNYIHRVVDMPPLFYLKIEKKLHFSAELNRLDLILLRQKHTKTVLCI